MKRSCVAAALFVMCACLTGTACAELLQRLHVTGIRVTSDMQRPRVNVPFHVTLTIHVRERITRLQFVSLPTYAGLENIGDTHTLAPAPGGGSVYRETLTLVAHAPGPVAIGSAYLDAVDLHDGRTKRFISNDVILHVVGPVVRRAPKALLIALAALLALVLLAAVLILLARRRRRMPVTGKNGVAPQFANTPRRIPAVPLDEALSNLRTRRDRAAVIRVREALWGIAEANEGETLDDVLQRAPQRTDGLRRILIAIERAMFVQDSQLPQAIENALSEGEHRAAQ